MKATVSKTLIINSPIQLSQIIVNQGLIDNTLFKDFCFIVSEYLKGCNCISDPNYSLMVDDYNLLANSKDVVDILEMSLTSNVIFESVSQ